jgi:heme/copper-type cytochrome/quinol oxidase subunit 3
MLCSLWRDIIREATFEDTSTNKKGLRLGMILFIVSEVMFFSLLGIFSF